MKRYPAPLPPWPRKKRFVVSSGATALILLIAYVLGGGFFTLGQHLGLIKSESIKQEVWKEVLSDEGVVRAIYSASTTKECINYQEGFQVSYRSPIRVATNEGVDACRQFLRRNSQGKDSLLYIDHVGQPVPQLIEEQLVGMSLVNTEPISFRSGVKLEGLKGGSAYGAYFLQGFTNDAWVLSVYPADAISMEALTALAKGFSLR